MSYCNKTTNKEKSMRSSKNDSSVELPAIEKEDSSEQKTTVTFTGGQTKQYKTILELLKEEEKRADNRADLENKCEELEREVTQMLQATPLDRRLPAEKRKFKVLKQLLDPRTIHQRSKASQEFLLRQGDRSLRFYKKLEKQYERSGVMALANSPLMPIIEYFKEKISPLCEKLKVELSTEQNDRLDVIAWSTNIVSFTKACINPESDLAEVKQLLTTLKEQSGELRTVNPIFLTIGVEFGRMAKTLEAQTINLEKNRARR
jgi:hypothetical protein